MQRRWGKGTVAVHAGTYEDRETGAVGTPIYQSATFYYPRKRGRNGSWVEDRSGYIYTREANPTVEAVERKVAALEGAPESLTFSSGMAAIASSLLAYFRPGGRVLSQAEIYGGSWIFLDRHLKPLGADVAFTSSYDADEVAESTDESTRLVYTEVPTNPFNRLIDLPRLRRNLEKRWGKARPLMLTDATLATPLNLCPLESGADLSLHSATKYLGGHSDVIAGVCSGSARRIEPVFEWRYHFGGCMDPHQAFLLERGLKTLHVRLRRQEANAKAVAEYLDGHPKVETVYHLSRPNHPDRHLARRLLKGPGALLSFRLRRNDRRAAVRFLSALELFAQAPSLGGVDSLATIPRETSHRHHSEKEARALGVTPSLVRLALGIEDAADLLGDVKRALASA